MSNINKQLIAKLFTFEPKGYAKDTSKDKAIEKASGLIDSRYSDGTTNYWLEA